MSELDTSAVELHEEIEHLRARIRELERREGNAKLTERWFVSLMHHLPHKVFFKDTSSRYLAVNQAFAADLGMSPAVIIGRTDLDLYPRELADRYRADDRDVMHSKRPMTVVVRYQVAGRSSHVEVTKIPLTDEHGEVVGIMGYFTHVSEKRHAEEALRRERHLLRMLMDNIPDSIYFKDGQSRFTRINRALAQRFGIDDPSESLGKTDFDYFSAEHAAEAFMDEQTVITLGEAIVDKEEMETWPDGKVNWVSTTKMPLRDQDGTIIGTFGISRDITARKAAEQALREQTQILQSVLDSIADGVVVTDQAGRFILVNPAAEQILGTIPTNTSPEEWIANYGFFLPDRSTPYPPNELPLLRALRGGAVDAVEVFVKTQTAPAGLWLSVDSRPLRNDGGELVGAVAAFRDVSARKRAEEALRTSEHRYRELFENANDIVYTHDLQGRMTTLNKTGEAAIGYSSSEAVGMRLEEFVAPEHLPRAKEMIRRKLAGHGSTTYELEIIAKDGRRVPLEVSTRIIYEGNHAVGVQGIARDITERRRSAEALQRQAQMLGEQAEELERRNEALSRAYAELKEAESQLIQSEKMAAIGQLVAGLAHEINNPAAFVLTHLTVIARDLDDMARYFDSCRKLEAAAHAFVPAEAEEIASLREELGIEESTEEVRSLVEAAKGGMTRIRDLVASLRSYSRIEMRGDFVMGDLNDGLRATLVLLRPIMPKGIVVELQERELPVVECNLGQINQVFMNLLVNAVQAIGEIGRIIIETGRQEEGVFVSIRDNGPGIPEGIRSRIFDPFFTTKEVGKGTGLGLSISRRIIEAHRGRIEVDSQPGVGTEFRIWLPLRQSQEESGERSHEE